MVNENEIGSFTFVLHSHLPWVLNHGNWPHGTSWLNEAASETYIPILNILHELVDEGYSPRITISLSPPLVAMLRHSGFKNEFNAYLDMKIDAAIHDIEDFTKYKFENRIRLARDWENFYRGIKDTFNRKFNQDIVNEFKMLQDKNIIELMTCFATHGYFPLLGKDSSVNAQIQIAKNYYKKVFQRDPIGIWLPECGYRPPYKWKNPLTGEEFFREGLEYFLAKRGYGYFIVDTHSTMGGETKGVYLERFPILKQLWEHFKGEFKPLELKFDRSPYEPYLLGAKSDTPPVAIFTRDEKTGLLVWSGEHGFPGDGNYLDFHKKHYPGGHRYWKVTAAKIDIGQKMEYYPEDVESRIEDNASHFKNQVKDILNEFRDKNNYNGIVVAPYDCELFGHWWFEGPRWLKKILKWMEDDPEIDLTTCSRYLDQNPPNKVITLPEGSWGLGGWHSTWLNDWTEWSYHYIYECESKMEEIVEKYYSSADDNLKGIIKQLGRELLLLQSSDWQFLISTWTARDYAENRIGEHYEKFIRLYNMAMKYGNGEFVDQGEWAYLGMVKESDEIFGDLDPNAFRPYKYE
jgi:1,4-alpha-glucan branching enzyme